MALRCDFVFCDCHRESLYEDDTFDQRQLAALVVSKVSWQGVSCHNLVLRAIRINFNSLCGHTACSGFLSSRGAE